MLRNDPRINGWKVIAAYLGRDRATVIRWANERGLPVHRVPGGVRGTVYAIPAELDLWAQSHADGAAAEPSPAAPPRSQTRRLLAVAAAAFAALLAISVWAWPGAAPPRDVLPADRAVAALYVAARDNASRRDKRGIDSAMAGFQTVIERDPGFAPAHAGLADAFLLSPEYGSLTYDSAYGRAKAVAQQALKLDPGQAEAHRALGYLAYWWEHDPAAAGKAFRQAIALAPGDGRAHFWYGAILIDNGEYAAARREFDAARLIDPGSVPIEMHLAYAKWREGDTQGGIRAIQDIIARNPRFALAYQHLAIIYAGEGNFAGYLAMVRKNDALRGSPQYSAYRTALETALRRGGDAALKAAVIDAAVNDEDNRPFPDHSLAAFLASSAGDRARLLTILELAERNRERWGGVGFTTRMAAKWRGDAVIVPLLKRRRAPQIEPAN